jgi:hypothetical protein
MRSAGDPQSLDDVEAVVGTPGRATAPSTNRRVIRRALAGMRGAIRRAASPPMPEPAQVMHIWVPERGISGFGLCCQPDPRPATVPACS